MPLLHRQTRHLERRQPDITPPRDGISIWVSGRTLRTLMLYLVLILPITPGGPNAEQPEIKQVAEYEAHVMLL